MPSRSTIFAVHSSDIYGILFLVLFQDPKIFFHVTFCPPPDIIAHKISRNVIFLRYSGKSLLRHILLNVIIISQDGEFNMPRLY